MKKWILCLVIIATPLLHSSETVEIIRSLAVRGSASLPKPADELRINIGVLSQGKTAKLALEENSSKMNQLIGALKKAGLTESEYQTGRFSIRPLYNQRPKGVDNSWTPKVVGFEVDNSLSIKTDKIDQAGSIIDHATQAGANAINSIHFQLKNPQVYRAEAIQAATKNAINDANSLSAAAGVKLKNIRSLSIDNAQALPTQQPYMMKSMMADSAPIIAGDIAISVSVTLIYEIIPIP